MKDNLYNQKHNNQTKKGDVPAKRVNVVSLKMVKECSVLYKNRVIRSPEDGYELFKQFLGDVDREHFVVACLDTKNQPTALNVCHVGSLNSSIVHPREVMKPAILSNAAGILIAHIGMKNQWRNYNLLYPQCYINFAFFLMAKLSLKVVMSLLVLSTAGSHLVFTNNKVV